MSNESTYSGVLGEWQRLEAALSANSNQIPHLEASRLILVDLLSQAQTLARQQAALKAEKQGITQELQATISDGQRLATVLRKGLQQHYGIRSEKLTEFGLQPFRGRTGRTEPQDPGTPIPPPVEAPASTAE
jgi:hypothetical protein